MVSYEMPSLADLKRADEEFDKLEPRDYFYWSATQLVTTTIQSSDELTRALMMFLTVWNRNYYRFFQQNQPDKTLDAHFQDVEAVIIHSRTVIDHFRSRTIEGFSHEDRIAVEAIFSSFSDILGRVGAAKCLHLLAPHFFPLWDAPIISGYRLEHKPFHKNTNDVQRYLHFMDITRDQITRLGDISTLNKPVLKALDQYNFCRFTKGISFRE